ncbi:MAG: hypothetical protein LBC50_01150 [Candidatus Ancillula sp.]|nr:hypothetical protein [Candidatus Ancillula sp.]
MVLTYSCILAHFWSLYQSPHYIFAGITVTTLAFTQRFAYRYVNTKLEKQINDRLNSIVGIALPIATIYLICIVLARYDNLSELLFKPVQIIKSAITTSTPWGEYEDTLAFSVVCVYVFSYITACCISFTKTRTSMKYHKSVQPRFNGKIITVATALIIFFTPTLIADSGTFYVPQLFSLDKIFKIAPINLHHKANLQTDSVQNLTDNYRAFFSKEKLKNEVLHVECLSSQCHDLDFITFSRLSEYNGVHFKSKDDFEQIVKFDGKTSTNSLRIKLKDYPYTFLPMTYDTTSLNITSPNANQIHSVYYSKAQHTVIVDAPILNHLEYEINQPDTKSTKAYSAAVQEFSSMFSKVVQHSYLSRAHYLVPNPPSSDSWLAEGAQFMPSFSGSNRGYIEEDFLTKVDEILDGSPDAPILVGDEEQLSALGYLLAEREGLDARLVTGAKLAANCITISCIVRGEDMRIWFEVKDPQSVGASTGGINFTPDAWYPIHFEIPTHTVLRQDLSKALPAPQPLKMESTRPTIIPRTLSNMQSTSADVPKPQSDSTTTQSHLPKWLVYVLLGIFWSCTIVSSVIYLKYRAYKCRRRTLVAPDLWVEFCLRLKRHELPPVSQFLTGTELGQFYKERQMQALLDHASPNYDKELKRNTQMCQQMGRIADFCKQFDEHCFRPNDTIASSLEVEGMWQQLNLILPRWFL